MKKIVYDRYVIADVDEATSSSSLEEVVQDFQDTVDIVIPDEKNNMVVVITTTEKNDEKFKALVAYFEKRTIGTKRLELRYDRYVLASMNEPTDYLNLSQVRTDAGNGLVIDSEFKIVIVLKTHHGIRSALVYSETNIGA
jgi:hypothetical protein